MQLCNTSPVQTGSGDGDELLLVTFLRQQCKESGLRQELLDLLQLRLQLLVVLLLQVSAL